MSGGGTRPSIVPLGDSAVLVVLGEGIDEETNRRVHALAERLDAVLSAGNGWAPTVPAYASLAIPYDPGALDASAAIDAVSVVVESVLRAPAASDPSDAREDALVEIPVRYGGRDGPDLDTVAERLRLSPDQVVALHARPSYRVFMLGFVPGFGYLGPLPTPLVLPRRDEPRARVPRGSVAIAGAQTAVYPLATAGGWHLIGRTDVQLWDPERDPPALLRPGLRVRFVALG